MHTLNARRIRTVGGCVLFAAALVLTAAACGRGGSASGNSGAAKVAIVTRDFTNPYWAALRDGAVDQAKKQGVTVNVQAGNSETDSTGENAKISTLAGQDYNCFGVVPVNATNVTTPLAPVAKKNIPIMNLDTQIDPTAAKDAGISFASFIGSDNLQAGTIAGQTLLANVKSGNVAILQGIAGEQNGINREQGFAAATGGKLDVVAKQPADYDQAKAQTVTDAILKAHPDIKGIFAANDTMGLGAAQSVQNAGKAGQVSIVSVDGIQAALQAVKAGTLSATVSQYPYAEGQLAVQACVNAVAKKPVPPRVVAPIALITKNNADKAIASFPQPHGTFILNAAPAEALPASLLTCCDVLIVNEHELRVVSGADPQDGLIESTHRSLLRRGVGAVVTTLGEAGAVLTDDAGTVALPAFPADVVDTTGAGDAFIGVLAARLAAGNSLADAVRWGMAAGSLAVRRSGAQESFPTDTEIRALLTGSDRP